MGSRTPDLLIANETLYQLSYDPIQFPVGRVSVWRGFSRKQIKFVTVSRSFQSRNIL